MVLGYAKCLRPFRHSEASSLGRRVGPLWENLTGPLISIAKATLMSNHPDFSDADRLLPVVAQDHVTGMVLMLAYMNEAAWQQTLSTGRATYFSRSRNKLWVKGEESGNIQNVKEIYVDCDGDTILLKVEQIGGAACHQGYESCFFRQVDGDGNLQVVGKRIFDPQAVYPGKDHTH